MNHDIDLVQQLVQWVEDEKFGWQLCYRASDDGWKAKDFHRKCDDVGSTVTLVKCKNNIFGGYTDQSWKTSTPGILNNFSYDQMMTEDYYKYSTLGPPIFTGKNKSLLN